jgi:chorismate mutase
MTVRAIRGATTLENDSAEQVRERTQELVRELMDRNEVTADDFISIIFTATPDIRSLFPAKAARELGLDDVPLLGAQELDVENAMQLCVRLLAHVETDRPRTDIHHVFQYGATALRADLAKPS